ncbi:glycine/betaine ABC transporter substrate-binding protein [Oceanobacillus piezotolerans]|uniref:Glycine/betaine ABC transporter substrate-binding protein n=1 Tax=Oceanobacillus piezotolerans TaxID=2448030 RepID=A0A498D7B2_9BACI|nr:glycine betaine ABC transporter substrate-binding protein [Oceanobacillus piezotolerans]RLL43904.1 glycine/betaine ABC transporter substrate-binding protein [Oceanobacillus piezotolerans]
MKKLKLLITLLIAGLVLAACGGGSDKEITIGSKNFTEQYLLAKMTTFILEDNGFEVDETTDLGSTALRQALENKQVDLTWDYVGTGLVTYLGEEPMTDPQEAYEKVNEIDQAENDIIWTNLNDVDNTYTLMMRQADAEELGIKSISDLAAYINENPGELTMASDAEFSNRDDGLPGVEEMYGFEFQKGNVIDMETGLNYNALRDGEVEVSVGFATDGRIEAFDFINLEDDKSFFPSYNAAVAMTTETNENYPELEEILAPLSQTLDSETMRKLNYEVDIEERSVDEVAKEYLTENGLIEN